MLSEPVTVKYQGSSGLFSSALAACNDPVNIANMFGWVVTSVPPAGGACTWYSSAQGRSLDLYSATAINSCSTGFAYNTSTASCTQTVAACPVGTQADAAGICTDPCANSPDVTQIVPANYAQPAGYLGSVPFPSVTFQAACGTMYMKSPDAILCDGSASCLITYGAGSKGAAAALAASPASPATCTALGLGYATSSSKTVCVGGGASNPSAPAPASGVPAASGGGGTSTTVKRTQTLTTVDPVTGVKTDTVYTTGASGSGTAPTSLDCPSCSKETTLQGLINWLKGTDGQNTDFTANRDALNQPKADQQTALNAVVADAVLQESADESRISQMFSFHPVQTACMPYAGNIHGVPVNIDICKYTEMLRSLLGWLWAVFGAYAMFQTIFKPRV